jgi:hypothetical protein
MKNSTVRFTSSTATMLGIQLRFGKKDIKVIVRKRNPGVRVLSGCKRTFKLTQVEEALAYFNLMVADAKKNGWTPRASRVQANAFNIVPMAPGFVPEPEETDEDGDDETTDDNSLAADLQASLEQQDADAAKDAAPTEPIKPLTRRQQVAADKAAAAALVSA